MFSNREYKIVILGAPGVGKSSITIQLVQHKFLETTYDPTIEDIFKKVIQINGINYSLSILDTAGQAEYSPLRDNYMKLGQGFLLVYSIDDKISFLELDNIYQQLLRVKDIPQLALSNPQLLKKYIPLVIIGHKSDLDYKREVQFHEGLDLANKFGDFPFIESCAKLNINITYAIELLIKQIDANDSINLNTNNDSIIDTPIDNTYNTVLTDPLTDIHLQHVMSTNSKHNRLINPVYDDSNSITDSKNIIINTNNNKIQNSINDSSLPDSSTTDIPQYSSNDNSSFIKQSNSNSKSLSNSNSNSPTIINNNNNNTKTKNKSSSSKKNKSNNNLRYNISNNVLHKSKNNNQIQEENKKPHSRKKSYINITNSNNDSKQSNNIKKQDCLLM